MVSLTWAAVGELQERRPVLGQCGPPGGSRDQGTALPFSISTLGSLNTGAAGCHLLLPSFPSRFTRVVTRRVHGPTDTDVAWAHCGITASPRRHRCCKPTVRRNVPWFGGGLGFWFLFNDFSGKFMSERLNVTRALRGSPTRPEPE